MTDGLLSLWHDVVIGSNDNNGNIGDLSTTGTHGSERLVTWRIEEGDVLAVLHLHVVSTDVLSDTTGLTSNHIRLADIVEERSLTVVNVSHHRNDWCARHEVFWSVFLFLHGIAYFLTHIRSTESELLSHQIDGFSIETLVDGHHDANRHTGTNNLCDRDIHHRGKVVGSHELGQLKNLAFCIFLLLEFCHTVVDILTLLLTILHTLLHLLVGEACECLLYLLCYFLVSEFCLLDRCLALLALLILASALLLILSTTWLLVLFLLAWVFLDLAGSRNDVHLLLVDAVTLLLLTRSLAILLSALLSCLLSLALAFLFLTLFLALLFALLVGACLGIDSIQVDETHFLELQTGIWSLCAEYAIGIHTCFAHRWLDDFRLIIVVIIIFQLKFLLHVLLIFESGRFFSWLCLNFRCRFFYLFLLC